LVAIKVTYTGDSPDRAKIAYSQRYSLVDTVAKTNDSV